MAASLALSDRTVNVRSAPSTPSTTPAASLIHLPDGPETPLAAASCRSACFASLELLDHAPPAAVVECENATPASPVLGSWELDRPVRPPHVDAWSELTPPACAPAPAAPSRCATPLVAAKPRAAKPRAAKPAKPVVTVPVVTALAVAEAAAAAPVAPAAAAAAPSAACERKKGPGGRYNVTRMRAAELAAKAKAKAEPTPNIKPEAEAAPANDAVGQPTPGGAGEQESKVTVPDVSRPAVSRPAVPQQPRRSHVPYAAAPLLHEGPDAAAAAPAEALVVFPLPGWPAYARCQPAQQRVKSPVSAGDCGLVWPAGSVSMISDALPVDVADAVAEVQPWIHDAFTSQWPDHLQFYDGGFEDLPFQQQYHTPLPEHHHDVAAAVPLQPPNPRHAADGNGDGDGAAAPAPTAPAASRQAQGRRGRKRENLNVSVESTASSTASTGSARRTIVTLALVELLHHKRTCVVPARLAAAAEMPGAYGEVPLFGDSETPTPVVGRIARVWKTARSDASAQGHIPLVRVLPAREGSAVFQELKRNDAHGLAAARRALAQMATMTQELRTVHILSVEFAVGSEHAVCAAFGHPGSFQSQRLATRLGNTLHTALRLVWVDSDGSPFSHCDAVRPSAPDPSMPRIPVGGRVKSATSTKAANKK